MSKEKELENLYDQLDHLEDEIQEIMGLVDDVIGCDSTGYQFECKRQIQSKLRELVERCSVREQSTPMQPIVVDDHGVLRFKKTL